MDASDAIWYGIGIPVAIGCCVVAVCKHFQKPVSTSLLKFTPQGMSCIRCFNKNQSVCSKPDCAFSKYE